MAAYALTIFLSAFLLFLLEPLVAKMILPWFGGSAGVWTVCLVFFQVVLLLGYLYAHVISRRLSSRAQGLVHIALLVGSLLLLPISPSEMWKPRGGEDPAGRILLLLIVSIGLPYLLLSSTGPLLQAWLVRTSPGRFPYRLFALSNFASLLALLSYPLVVEPAVSTHGQATGWSAGYAVFALLCAWSAWRQREAGAAGQADGVSEERVAAAPAWQDQFFWLALAACGSVLLLAITNQLSQNIAAIPFLWILPLAIYLLTFILCFQSSRVYHRGLMLRLLAVALGAMSYYVIESQGVALIQVGIPIFLGGLFVCCLFCHGELAQRKPASRYLTSYYLMISVGGAIGAVLVGVVAPHVFANVYELAASFLLTALLALLVVFQREWWERLLWAGMSIAMALVCIQLVRNYHRNSVMMVRNFYGGLRIVEESREDPAKRLRILYHGTINHGSQFFTMPRRARATTYYGEESGGGLAIKQGCPTPCKVGLIGMGTGTLAAYSRAGDTYRFYEINPLVIFIARDWFTYITGSRARIETAVGDARLSLEREEPQQFDVLIVDAFSGDAIPVHLLTKEAVELYGRHLKPGGIMAFHVSNLYLDLAPVVQRLGQVSGRQSLLISDPGDHDEAEAASDWVLLSDRPGIFQEPALARAGEAVPVKPQWRTWTDSYNNLFQVVRW